MNQRHSISPLFTMTRNLFRMTKVVTLASACLATSAQAARTLDEATIVLRGEQRHYYRIHDTDLPEKLPAIVLISGSGCADFASRFPTFFSNYPAPLDVYFLEKNGIEKGDNGEKCRPAYDLADTLQQRVAEILEFIDTEARLKNRQNRSLALLGFSEGGAIAPLVALQSHKVGWLATVGAGGMRQADGFLTFADRGVAPYAKPFSRQYFLQQYAAIAKDPDNLNKEFFGHPYHYWNTHLFYEPLQTYAQLDIPMVAAMGEKDESEPIESGRKLQQYFASHPEKNFQFVEYAGGAHNLKVGDKANIYGFVANLAKWFNNEPHPFDHD